MKHASSAISYRTVIYAGTLLTGMTALIFQIAWQKYLSYLVGSEARSVSLVVAVFLFGLATGYRFWGVVAERLPDRRKLLKLYGYVELGIGAFAISFPQVFRLVRTISYGGPDSLAMDTVTALLVLFLPTFLMGATIPLLTTLVPERLAEVNTCHARIYGLNTLGAFAGAFAGGFLLIPRIGLSMSLLAGGLINLSIALVFITNSLSGRPQRETSIQAIDHPFSKGDILSLVFVSGAVSISLEVLFVRILGLTIGSGHYIFPIVVGVFVLGLALGSLSLRGKALHSRRLYAELGKVLFFLAIIYLTIPYWPYWLNSLRLSLPPTSGGFETYLLLVTLFLVAALLPFLLSLGRLLPLGYAFIDKNSRDYGKVCGRVYFINTIGTAVGAVFFGYHLLKFVDIDRVFKVNIFLVALLLLVLLTRGKHRRTALLLLPLMAGLLLLPRWDRSSHHLGLFRVHSRQQLPFDGLFRTPRLTPNETAYFADGPNTTLTVLRGPGGGAASQAATFVVNGKSDGNTDIDYSTMSLIALLPYLYAPEGNSLDTVVVGLGTGITAGILGRVEDVAKVHLLEISPLAISTAPYFDPFSYGLSTNPRVEFHATDAFRYFARSRRPAELIVSEPSSSWVVGVENLFTPEFYDLVKRNLSPRGVFMQWIQLGENSNEVFASMLANLTGAFDHLKLYKIGVGDVGIVASSHPLTIEQPRFEEAVIRTVADRLRIFDLDSLALLEVFDRAELELAAGNSRLGHHSLDTPRLGLASGRAMFQGDSVELERLLHPSAARLASASASRADAFSRTLNRHRNGIPSCENAWVGEEIFCRRFALLKNFFDALADSRQPPARRLEAYGELRGRGLIPPDTSFLDSVMAKALHEGGAGEEGDDRALSTLIPLLFREYAREGNWEQIGSSLNLLEREGFLPAEEVSRMEEALESNRRTQETLLHGLRRNRK